MRAEKRAYLEYQKAADTLERLTKLVKAYEWSATVEKAAKAKDNVKQKKEAIAESKEDVARGQREVEGMERDKAELQRKRDKVGR